MDKTEIEIFHIQQELNMLILAILDDRFTKEELKIIAEEIGNIHPEELHEEIAKIEKLMKECSYIIQLKLKIQEEEKE